MCTETQNEKSPGGQNQSFSQATWARCALKFMGYLYPHSCHLSSLFNYTIQPVINQGIIALAVLVARPGGVA